MKWSIFYVVMACVVVVIDIITPFSVEHTLHLLIAFIAFMGLAILERIDEKFPDK